jgi:hypothetical protein
MHWVQRRRDRAEPTFSSEVATPTESTDATPVELLAFAHAALDWRRIGADLAELCFDSVLDPEPAAAAPDGEGARRLAFRAAALSIELEVERAGDGRTLSGRLAPTAAVRLEVEAADGAIVSSGEPDADGRFRLVLPGGGRVRLRLVPTTPGAAFVETSWVTV